MERLRQRADFVALAGHPRVSTAAFTLQVRRRDDSGPARVGFTVSKKVGNAVIRNRVRRRLRRLVELAAPALKPQADHVLIGRPAALTRAFAQMADDLRSALQRIDRPRAARPSSGNGPGAPLPSGPPSSR